jgi:hypothetical protein
MCLGLTIRLIRSFPWQSTATITFRDALNVLEEYYLEDGKRHLPELIVLADHRHSGFPRRF